MLPASYNKEQIVGRKQRYKRYKIKQVYLVKNCKTFTSLYYYMKYYIIYRWSQMLGKQNRKLSCPKLRLTSQKLSLEIIATQKATWWRVMDDCHVA